MITYSRRSSVTKTVGLAIPVSRRPWNILQDVYSLLYTYLFFFSTYPVRKKNAAVSTDE